MTIWLFLFLNWSSAGPYSHINGLDQLFFFIQLEEYLFIIIKKRIMYSAFIVGSIWSLLALVGLIWPWFIWCQLALAGLSWIYLVSIGPVWPPLALPDLSWLYLTSVSRSWPYSASLSHTFRGICRKAALRKLLKCLPMAADAAGFISSIISAAFWLRKMFIASPGEGKKTKIYTY